jgi:hypothetical protein
MRIVTLSRLKYGASCLNNFDQGSWDMGQYYKYHRKDQQRWAGRGAGDKKKKERKKEREKDRKKERKRERKKERSLISRQQQIRAFIEQRKSAAP